jgi:hypothetical protein
MIINGKNITNEEELNLALLDADESSKLVLYNMFHGIANNTNPTVKERDVAKYLKRAEAKNIIVAEMSAENVERVRSGEWSLEQLISLTQDAELIAILNDLNTLSFELAQEKIANVANLLLTPEIKASYIAKIQTNLFDS